MERLTKQWGNNCVPIKLDLECLLDMSDEQAEQLRAIIKKLADYEDAEEQGLILRLPCKVGDTVWLANKLFSSEVKCLTIRWIEIVKGIGFRVELENGSGLLFYDYEIGKTVFLTKAEAEQKLAEIRGDNNV